MFIISIPKGRNFFLSIFFLKKNNIKLIEKIFRKTIIKTNRFKIYIIILKNKDILKLSKLNIIFINFIGKDILNNYNIKNYFIKITKSSIYINDNFFLFTKFINITKYYNINRKIINLSSNIEFFLEYKYYGILDILETCNTLYKNNKFPQKLLFKIYLLFIINYKNKKFKKIFNVKNKI